MHSSPTVADGMVYAASSTSAYYGINAQTGEIVWHFVDTSAEEFILCSPIYNDGSLYIINKFSILSLDAKTGEINWESFIGDELYVSPTYADNKLYVATDQRHLFVLNATNGEKLDFYTFTSNSWSSPSIYGGRVYLGNNDWSVYCFSEYPALSSSLSISLSTVEAKTGELVTGQGQLVPGLSNATITTTFLKPDGSTYTVQTVTDKKGGFVILLVPDIEGNWTISAQFIVNKSYYTSSISEPVTLVVAGSIEVSPSGNITPNGSHSQSPSNQTIIPWDQQKIGDIPLIYIYVSVILVLIAVIAITGSVYLKNSKTEEKDKNNTL